MKVYVIAISVLLACRISHAAPNAAVLVGASPSQNGNISSNLPTADLTGGLTALSPSSVLISPDQMSAYVLGPGDGISIAVTPQDKYSAGGVTVGQDGKFMYPRLGELNAAGLTVDQLRDQITQQLQKYCVNPDVSISVTAMRPEPIYVTGGVGSPKILDVRAASTIAKAITLAGGASDQNMLTRVTIYRGTQVLHANVYPILINGVDNGENLALEPNDFIVVPINTQRIAILGAVNSPGVQSLELAGGNEGPVRLSDALSQAGGVSREGARIHEVRLIRLGPDGKPIMFKYDYGKFEQFGDISQDPVLQDKDMIVVPDSRQSANLGDLFTAWSVYGIFKAL